jgi:hypothetical protein
MIMDILLSRYWAFSDRDRSRSRHFPAFRAARDVLAFYYSCKQVHGAVNGVRDLRDRVIELRRTLRAVNGWCQVSDFLLSAMDVAMASGSDLHCLPAHLHQLVHHQIELLCDSADIAISYDAHDHEGFDPQVHGYSSDEILDDSPMQGQVQF